MNLSAPKFKSLVEGELPGFNNCEYRVMGIKIEPGKGEVAVKSEWKKAADEYTFWDKKEVGVGVVKWRRLDLHVRCAGFKSSPVVTECDNCSICFHQFSAANEELLALRCKHVFHAYCLDSWTSKGNPMCPLCRGPVDDAKLELKCVKSASGGKLGYFAA